MWINDGLAYWCINVSLQLEELAQADFVHLYHMFLISNIAKWIKTNNKKCSIFWLFLPGVIELTLATPPVIVFDWGLEISMGCHCVSQ